MRLALLLLVGCSSVVPSSSPPRPPPPPPPESPTPSADACQLRFRATLRGTQVAFTAENLTDAELRFELPGRCPHGPLELSGLGPGFDYYGACAMGACLGPGGPWKYVVPPRGQTAVVSIELHPEGSSCTPPLASGEITPVAPPLAVTTCTTSARFDFAGVDARDPYACRSPGDCVLSCPDAPGCCGWPCGCRHAINARHADRFAAEHARTCQKAPDCPAVACAYEPALWATCRAGRCVAGDGP